MHADLSRLLPALRTVLPACLPRVRGRGSLRRLHYTELTPDWPLLLGAQSSPWPPALACCGRLLPALRFLVVKGVICVDASVQMFIWMFQRCINDRNGTRLANIGGTPTPHLSVKGQVKGEGTLGFTENYKTV